MEKITEAQQKVLCFISERIEREGLPPTYAEMANELKFKSDNAAFCHVKALAAKGLVEMRESISRGISITADGVRQLPAKERIDTDQLMADFMAYRAMYTAAREELNKRLPDGITAEQFVVLKMLCAGPVYTDDLAVRSGILPPSLSRMLNDLEEIAAVSRRQCQTDNRRKLVRILKAGKDLVRAAK